MGRGQDDAVHVPFDQRLHQLPLQVAILVADRKQRHGVALGENVLQARGELGEVRIDELGEDDPDRVAAVGAKRGSGPVVDVALSTSPCWTRARVFSATSGLLFSTRLTVARETPQCLATSISVGRGMSGLLSVS